MVQRLTPNCAKRSQFLRALNNAPASAVAGLSADRKKSSQAGSPAAFPVGNDNGKNHGRESLKKFRL